MLFFITWIAGVAGAVGAVLNNGPIEATGTVSRLLLPSDGLWRGAIFNLEPATVVAVASGSREAAANPFTSVTAPAGRLHRLGGGVGRRGASRSRSSRSAAASSDRRPPSRSCQSIPRGPSPEALKNWWTNSSSDSSISCLLPKWRILPL